MNTDKVLKITFKKDVDIDLANMALGYENNVDNSLSGIVMTFQFAPRNSSNKIQIYDPASLGIPPYTNIQGEYTAELFSYYFNIDKPSWVSEVESSGAEVFITINDNDIVGTDNIWTFILATIGPIDNTVGWADWADYFSYEVLDSTTFAITDVLFSTTGADVCNFVKMRVETTTFLDKMTIYSIGQISYLRSLNPALFPESNVFEAIIQRGISHKIKAESVVAVTLDLEDSYPNSGRFQIPFLSESNFVFYFINGQGGITTQIIHNIQSSSNDINLELEYSFDGINWFEESLLTGQEEIEYEIYIRDQFGCQIQVGYQPFLLSDERVPYHFISEANAINFSLSQEINDCSIHRNYDNALSSQSLNNKKYCDDILINTCDNTTIQFKTNYENISVTLRKEDDVDVNVPLLQRTNNFNVFEAYDCNGYNYTDQLAGLFFTSGNVYNEALNIIDTFELNGNLPAFAKKGNTINLAGVGTFLIQDVIYDENIQKNVILIQNNFVSLPFTGIVLSTYNILDYNVFEFGFIWSSLGEGLYDVIIQLSDNDFDDVVYQSENIYVKLNHENTLCIDYYNDYNRDIFYKFGIRHRIRIPYLKIDYNVKDENESNYGDVKAELVKSIINKSVYYYFDALTEKRRMTLILALSSEYCFINGIKHIKEAAVDLEHIQNTNLANVNQNLIVSGEQYSTIRQTNASLSASISVQSFLTSGINFLNIS